MRPILIERLRLEQVQQHVEHDLEARHGKGQAPPVRQRHQHQALLIQLGKGRRAEKVFPFREVFHEDREQVDFLPFQLHADLGVEPIGAALRLGVGVPLLRLRHAKGKVRVHLDPPALRLQLRRLPQNKIDPFALLPQRPIIGHLLRTDIINPRRRFEPDLFQEPLGGLLGWEVAA